MKERSTYEHWGRRQWHVTQRRSKRYKEWIIKWLGGEEKLWGWERKEGREEMEEGYRATVCEITNAGINRTINLLGLSVCFPSSSFSPSPPHVTSNFLCSRFHSGKQFIQVWTSALRRTAQPCPLHPPNTPRPHSFQPPSSPSSLPPLIHSHLLFVKKKKPDSSLLSEGHQLTLKRLLGVREFRLWEQVLSHKHIHMHAYPAIGCVCLSVCVLFAYLMNHSFDLLHNYFKWSDV